MKHIRHHYFSSQLGWSMRFLLTGLTLLLCAQFLTGCSLWSKPPNMALENLFKAAQTSRNAVFQGKPLHYTTQIELRMEQDDPAEREALTKLVEGNSQLIQLAKQLPDSLLSLERRARGDVGVAEDILKSRAFYGGKAIFSIQNSAGSEDTVDAARGPALVILMLETGPQYTMGPSKVHYLPPPLLPPSFPKTFVSRFHTSLQDPEEGQPALADKVLDSVEKVPDRLRRRGFPFAKVAGQHFYVNHEKRQLEADILVTPGRAATLGKLQVEGNKKVKTSYLERLVPWQEGQPWSENQLNIYQEILQQTGLFNSVLLKPVSAETMETDVLLEVSETKFRTASAGLKYSTDLGLAGQASFEHRNVWGNGEKVRTDLTLSQDKQDIKTSFTKPAFMNISQRLLVEGGYIGEKTDAYTQRALHGSAAVEKMLDRTWSYRLQAKGEIGNLKDYYAKKDYSFVGISLKAIRNTAGRSLNPTRGTRLEVELAPHMGKYGKSFGTLISRLDARVYYSPFDTGESGPKARQQRESLILAGRFAVGAMLGGDFNNIPKTLRFYSGGGGSVRGYAYQNIGPKDPSGEPLGGSSFQEISFEARIRVTDSISVVPFVDAGMVYSKSMPNLFRNLAWAVGIGLRYATPIGPLRVDLAFPLHKGRGDKPYHLYISIGQAF